jgi:predicted nuclease with TOPRIM domain
MSIQIETELKDILAAIDRKLDKIDERLGKLEIGQARLEEKWKAFQSAWTIRNFSVAEY